MSATAIILKNEATVVFGFDRRGRDLEVSPDVKLLGLDMLRAMPFEVTAYAIPDYVQPRYGDYVANLPSYMSAIYHQKKSLCSGIDKTVTWDSIKNSDLLPFRTIPTVLSWGAHIPEETLESIRAKLDVEEGVSGGKPALIFTPQTWKDYDMAKGYGANIRAVAPIEHANLKAIIRMRLTLAIFAQFLSIHTYPAFTDTTHERNFYADTHDSDEMDTTDHPLPEGIKFIEIAKTEPRPMEIVPLKNIYIDATKLPTPATTPGYVDVTENRDSIPDWSGLWFPFIPALSQYDSKTVPFVLERYFLECLDDTHEGIVRMMEELRGDWGILGKTRTGKEVTHLAKCIDLSIRAQARPIAIFRSGLYVGCFMGGAGYTVAVENLFYRPSSYTDVLDAIKTTDLHVASLKAIAQLIGGDLSKKKILAAKSMLELRTILLEAWTKEKDREDLMRHANGLDFGEKPWEVNISTIRKAITAIKDGSINLKTELPGDFPIHRSMLLTDATLDCVWSCFGSYAPSFRIPGGKPFDIGKEMEIDQRRGDKKVVQKFVRIVCRNKPLDIAIKDLRDTMSTKQIVNPLIAPKVRASARNMDRVFVQDDGRALMVCLSQLCDISAANSKRPAPGSHDEEPRNKKSKTDLDGW